MLFIELGYSTKTLKLQTAVTNYENLITYDIKRTKEQNNYIIKSHNYNLYFKL